jgi:dihydrofolate reductase
MMPTAAKTTSIRTCFSCANQFSHLQFNANLFSIFQHRYYFFFSDKCNRRMLWTRFASSIHCCQNYLKYNSSGCDLPKAAQRILPLKDFAPSTCSKRQFSVKELPWCSPSDSPNRRLKAAALLSLKNKECQEEYPASKTHNAIHQQYQPIDKFGIVAAMAASSRVIGVNGKLPWKSPTDREIFKQLTQNRILLVGRKTLQEERDRSLGHVRHAKYCIVVSTSVSSVDDLWTVDREEEKSDFVVEKDPDWKILRVAASLDEALDLARSLQEDIEHDAKSSISDVRCWVAGGQRLFEEALKHPSASELHLSVMDVDVDITNFPVENVAKFPAKYRWDHNFQETLSQDFDDMEDEPSFTYHVYRRIQRNNKR